MNYFYLALGVVIGGVVGILFSGYAPEAAVGFIGVLVGALIPVLYQRVAATEDRLQQLRMAAIDKRLSCHQEAYALWWEILHHVHDKDKILGVAEKCRVWWEKNCLYLEPSVRDAFRGSYMSAADHATFVAHGDKDVIHQNWDRIIRVSQEILDAVALPLIQEVDTNIPEKQAESTAGK